MLPIFTDLNSNIKPRKVRNLICLLKSTSALKQRPNTQVRIVFFVNYSGNKNKKLKLAEMNLNKLKISFQSILIINGLKWQVKKIEQFNESTIISHKSNSYRYEILVEKLNQH